MYDRRQFTGECEGSTMLLRSLLPFAYWEDNWCLWATRLQYNKAGGRETYSSGQAGDSKLSDEWQEQWIDLRGRLEWAWQTYG